MGKSQLKIRCYKRGLCVKKDYVMNMTVLHHEYKGVSGVIVWGRGWGVPCLSLISGQGIVQRQQCYDLSC